MTQPPFIPARPTIYKGIRMRSRLEADFAQHWLDDPNDPQAWEYEPNAFADETGQYLPDFLYRGSLVKPLAEPWYIEVKPPSLLPAEFTPEFSQEAIDSIDRVLRRMEVIRSSNPGAALVLIFWDSLKHQVAARIYQLPQSPWYFNDLTGDYWALPGLWLGMGQLQALLRLKEEST